MGWSVGSMKKTLFFVELVCNLLGSPLRDGNSTRGDPTTSVDHLSGSLAGGVVAYFRGGASDQTLHEL